jgi:hypothetical protein
MIRWMTLLIMVCSTASFVDGQQARSAEAVPAASPRFSYVDVYLDAKAESLAAWQFEFAAEKGRVTVVGIEGGEHPAFAKNPPYYDPAALGQNRVILAAFSTDNDLPKGRTRIARIHLMIEGDEPKYAAKLVVAANSAGKTIPGAALSLSEGARP